jgi:isoleucyl-tRNA synthetase
MDETLEKRMDYAQRICSLALSIRKKDKIRVRQPLQKLLLPVLDESFIAEVDGVRELILSEINVKELEYVTDSSGLLKKSGEGELQNPGCQVRQGYEGCSCYHRKLDRFRYQSPRKRGQTRCFCR